MIKLKTLRRRLDELFPGNGMADSAVNGLQVEGREEIHRIVTGVSASLATIEAAVKEGADALVVHHGLFWQRDNYVIEGVKKLKLSLLFQHGISLFAYHLPMDMHPTIGNNWKAAIDMKWRDLQPFGFYNGAYVGVKGIIPPTPRDVFRERLESYYQHAAVCALGGPSVIERVSLISGGAYKSIVEAVQEGIDAFITGSFDEPVWHQAFEEGINFFALGHSATERVGPIALADFLRKELHLPCDFLDLANPF